MAGIIRLQIDAATITPAANPVKILCMLRLILPLRKKTQAAPAVVPRKGMRIALNAFTASIMAPTPITAKATAAITEEGALNISIGIIACNSTTPVMILRIKVNHDINEK